MKKWADWWKQDKRYVTMIKAVLLAALPLLCCMAYCASQGITLGQIYLPASQWNDELFYYKQVEGILNFGYPQGYFGFNESHALKLSFAAWSPVLVLPWVLWGLIFGWNLMSPVICNIALMALCFFLFGWLVKPSWRQTGILAVLFSLFRLFTRYTLSAMSESICLAMVVLLYGLALNYLKRERTWKLTAMLLLGVVMTLMRPYLLLFLLLPMCFWVRKSRWKGALGSAAVLTLTAALYACIKHYLGAEYFTPLFFTDWIEAFFTRGLFGGIRFTLGKLYWMGRGFLSAMWESFRTGVPAGAICTGYTLTMLALVYQGIADYVKYRRGKKKGDFLVIEGHIIFSFAAMLAALLLMYKLTEGSRHLMIFILAGIIVIAVMDTKFFKKTALLGITFFFLYSHMAVSDYDYQVPFLTEERQSQIEDWTAALKDSMQIAEEGAPSFDNVVIWTIRDSVGSGDLVAGAWQYLYALPEGFGVSCCEYDYVTENFESLKSRYLFSTSGGQVDELCREAGYREIYRGGDMVLYQSR